MCYALDEEVIEVANCGSNINMFSNISGEKRLDTQHQYEQGHKKPFFFVVVVKYSSWGQVSLQHHSTHIVLVIFK